MKQLQFITCLIFSCLLNANLAAQSIEALTQVAVEDNLELKILKNEYLAALEKAPQVSQLPDPELGVGGFPLPVETRLGAQILRLSATQMFPWFGTIDQKKDLELAKAKALFQRIAARVLDINYEIKKTWYQLYELNETQSVLRRNITLLETLKRLALSKVESGKGTAADVLRVQLKTTELKQELEILETAKLKPLAAINQLLNRPSQTPVNLSDSLSFTMIPFDKDSITAAIQSTHPMLRMFQLQQEVSKKSIALNELNGKPSFGFGLDYIMVNKRSDMMPARNGRDIIQVRATVKVPLYRQKFEAKEREEKLIIATLDYKKEDVLSRFNAVIEQAFADYEMARLKIELYEQQISITESAIKILETSFSAKGNNFDELLRLEIERIDYDLKMLKAIVQSHFAKASIERFIIQ